MSENRSYGAIVSDDLLPDTDRNVTEQPTRISSKKRGIKEWWINIKQSLQTSKSLKLEMKKELCVLSNSLINISKMFHKSNNIHQADIILRSEDIISRFLSFVEFWRQKSFPLDSVIFIFKTLDSILTIPIEFSKNQSEITD